jgi:cellulose synthase/poly-beta-1,6-N-acetylglucosamine synthase-like glycosyltransferase
MSFLFWLGVGILSIYILLGLDLVIGNRTIRFLRSVSPDLPSKPPRVTIVVAARNEERNIRDALGSLLNLDYSDLELIVINDRSEDQTGPILNEIAKIDRRLQVVNVDELPSGWLGKNHALWIGSKQASGELLLFTDADVIMEPSVLNRAVNFLLDNRLDHLVATPSMRMPTIFLEMFGAFFVLFFTLFARPWKAKDPKSYFHIGIGAFNLVRAVAYQKVGGHETIRMRPDDDLKLGKIIKKAGFRQDVVLAPEFLCVEWYTSLRDVIRGLEKNAFSGADYNVALVLFGVLFQSLCCAWPYIALFVTHGLTFVVYVAIVGLITLFFAHSAGLHGARRWYVVGFPFASLLFIFILLRTMILNIVQGGIYWRGTFYSLKELKKNKV